MGMDMNKLLQQAQQMQEELAAKQQEVAGKEFEGTAAGGMVVVRATGGGEVLSVKIDKQVIDPAEAELLEDAVLAATNAALRAATEEMENMAKGMLGGMDLGGMGLPGL